MTFKKYIQKLNGEYQSGKATELTYRYCLKDLLETQLSDVKVVNEPKQIECGSPDYIINRNQIPIGYIEAKDVEANLDDPKHDKQLDRYKKSLDNLIFTNYLEFRFFCERKLLETIVIGEIRNGKIKPKNENFDHLGDLFCSFAKYEGRTITSAIDLVERMVSKTRMLERVITKALRQEAKPKTSLQEQFDSFKKHLIGEIKPDEFSDIYAQTIAYGMFAARLHDSSPNNFNRFKAAQSIPSSNPFLQKLFRHIAGYELDERISWIVDDLVSIFRATDVSELMKDYGKSTQQDDPFIHFYETFLGKYKPKLKMQRGVYYTPEPIVSFIVRAVDEILKTEFNLQNGLADTQKTVIEVEESDNNKVSKVQKEVHKVQILDPATGTGTFLAHIARYIHKNYFNSQQGNWSGYVKNHLIPRLNGFELLMAPYAMAHIKLERVLQESGCELDGRRLNIFLTNSLEELRLDIGELPFAEWFTTEANEANRIKCETPVMVVLGNPPYSNHSVNKGKWIQSLIDDYKKDLNERKQNLADDYIKFIRYGEYMVNSNGDGVLAYISNNSFLWGVTHRQMRKHLLQTFDKIYILDLHGNARLKEKSPDGSVDENVFNIMQGVSINIFIKTGKKKEDELAQVFHYDLYDNRESKYKFLWNEDNSLKQISFTELQMSAPYYFFIPKDFSSQTEYEKGISLVDIFSEYNSGIQTKRDKLTVSFNKDEIEQVKQDMLNLGEERIRDKYKLPADGRDWKIKWAKDDIANNNPKQCSMLYRPFDVRHTLYTGKTKGFLSYPRHKTMQHFLGGG